jgi:GH18 family chitinase
LAKKQGATEAAVVELRDWAHANGIRVMLCVYNAGGGKWDWPLARSAFAKHGEAFAKNLVAEVEQLGLDGVDVDLEGNGSFDADKAAFVTFMTNLSKQLHDRGKHLTVDTFSYQWNAPAQTWWPELLPLVDGLTTMGYESIGASAPEWRAYAAQRDAAGTSAAKLQIGMPSGKDNWKGNTALEQLNWVKTDGKTGVAIWDAQFRNAAWRKPEVWEKLKAIRGGDASK